MEVEHGIFDGPRQDLGDSGRRRKLASSRLSVILDGHRDAMTAMNMEARRYTVDDCFRFERIVTILDKDEVRRMVLALVGSNRTGDFAGSKIAVDRNFKG